MVKLYDELADWYHLFTHPDDYADEAACYRQAFLAHAATPPRTLLELGCGGGNNASYLKRDFTCTLSDLSPAMVRVSQGLNPECEHVVGDMRTLRLGREFDAVLVHDAISYMLSEGDLRAALATAFVHCRPGGVAVIAPDETRERFAPATCHGGHDGDGRALRYLEWSRDSDPGDTIVETDFIVALEERGKEMRLIHDRHLNGLFPLATWTGAITAAGFRLAAVLEPDAHDGLEVFVAVRPAA
jgi:SAM-dependent methyltransferase